MKASEASGPSGSPSSRSGWLVQQPPASRAYFAVVMAVGIVALVASAFHPAWTTTPWFAVAGWSVLAVLTSFSIGLQLRKLADGAGTVTMRDVWTLSALFLWSLPAALAVNLALVLWSEAVTKTRVEDRPFVPARAGFNAAFTSLALIAAWGVIQAGGGPADASWKTWLVAGVVFEAVTVLAVELHVLFSRSPRRLSQALIVLAAMCLTEVPLAIVLAVSARIDPLLAVLLTFPMFVAAAGLQYILEFIELRDLVSTDSRTGLLTPAAWRDATEKLVRTQKIAVLMADLDGFKALNDTYGHLTGDEILRQVGDILISSIRPLDLACRWGGEEFVLVLANTSVRDAVLVADRIRTRVADEARHNGAAVTISIGVAGCPATGTQQLSQALTTTMGLADEALYRAKGEGRNRVAAIGADAR